VGLAISSPIFRSPSPLKQTEVSRNGQPCISTGCPLLTLQHTPHDAHYKDYNLGAANIPCRWDDQELGEWTEITAKNSQFTSRDFFVEYGILIATVASFLLFIGIFSKITKDRMNLSEAQHNNRYLRNVMQQEVVDDKSNALMPENEVTVA
jgi:hypothetical protein